MNKTKKLILSLTLALSAFVALPILSHAAEAPAAPQNKADYLRWLEQYDAWDKVESSIAQDDESPELILKRARIYLEAGNGQIAAQLLDQTPAFSDQSLEAERLWLGGQAFRASGDPAKAVLWFSQAGRILSSGEIKSRFSNEPQLETLWIDVWRKMYWDYLSNPSLSREAQKMTLTATLQQAQSAWRGDFWQDAANLILPSQNGARVPANPYPALTISGDDRGTLARCLASASLGDFEQARKAVSAIADQNIAHFWLAALQYMEQGSFPPVSVESGYAKARAFQSAGVMLAVPADAWTLGQNNSPAWTRFRDKLLKMSASQAVQAVDAETQSMLITQDTLAMLQAVKFAFAVISGDNGLAKSIWDNQDKASLPLSLKVCGLALFNDSIRSTLSRDTKQARLEYGVLSAMASAAGAKTPDSPDAPFWMSLTPDQLNDAMAKLWPMDRLLIMADWESRWSREHSSELARRILLLFPETGLGTDAALFLTHKAITDKNAKLAEFYASRIPDHLGGELELRRMEIQAMLLMITGHEDAALKAFNDLVAKGGDLDPMTRLKLALLLQQRGDLTSARDHLQALWARHDSLPSALQAEILFWLGEGEQAMGNKDSALDYYLRLAWKYPQENIWALTAMYRAAMIYEGKGYFDTARKLLGTVVKNASTTEQREAAKARLAAIDLKVRNQGISGATGNVTYPF